MPDRSHTDVPNRRDEGGFAELIVLVLVAVLVLLVVGLVVDPFAVVLAGSILLGGLVITALVLGIHHGMRRRARAVPLDADRLRRVLDNTIAESRTKLSAPTLVKVGNVRRMVLELIPRSDALAGDVESLHLIERTVLDYLPTALASYLELPREYATTVTIRDGKTSQDLLLEQVTLLEDAMQRITDSLNRRSSERLMIHGRFLEDRFRRDRDLARRRFEEQERPSRDAPRIEPPDDGLRR